MNKNTYRLVIGDKNYSSWSLRPWLAMRMFDIPFDEIHVDLFIPGRRGRILEFSPSGRVPALIADNQTIWDSLAIIEYLNDHHHDKSIWPNEGRARAIARAVSAEMHSGFEKLRRDLPMDIVHTNPIEVTNTGTAQDIARIVEMWRMCRENYGSGGPYLFGEFSAADAMFAPVATRFRSYGVDLGNYGDDGTGTEYCQTIFALPLMQSWTDEGRQELSQRGTASERGSDSLHSTIYDQFTDQG